MVRQTGSGKKRRLDSSGVPDDDDSAKLSSAAPTPGFDPDQWATPVSLPTPSGLDAFRLEVLDNSPTPLVTTQGWETRAKAAAIARAIARADPAITLRKYRGKNTPRKSAGRFETFIQPDNNNHWQIAARHNPDATWSTKTASGSDGHEPDLFN